MSRGDRAGYLFAGPVLLAILLLFVLPVGAALVLSVTDFDIYALADLRNLRWVGLDNYATLLDNPRFWRATFNTLLFAALGAAPRAAPQRAPPRPPRRAAPARRCC